LVETELARGAAPQIAAQANPAGDIWNIESERRNAETSYLTKLSCQMRRLTSGFGE